MGAATPATEATLVAAVVQPAEPQKVVVEEEADMVLLEETTIRTARTARVPQLALVLQAVPVAVAEEGDMSRSAGLEQTAQSRYFPRYRVRRLAKI